MLAKRIIPCLDVKNGRVVKGRSFVNLRDAGDTVQCGRQYSEQGADELVFLDITATLEARQTIRELAAAVGREVFIPYPIGGGIASLDDIPLRRQTYLIDPVVLCTEWKNLLRNRTKTRCYGFDDA